MQELDRMLAAQCLQNEADRDPRRKPIRRKPRIKPKRAEPWEARRRQYLRETGRL